MNNLLKKLNIDETLTRPIKKEKVFTKVKDNIPHKADYNFMADILMLPETKQGFRYLLTVVDLATDEFDAEPLKTKNSDEVLKAFKNMFKRPFIKEPYASVRTDDGKEFKGIFSKWLYDESILHRVAEPGRHKQTGNVEALNGQLGRILNGYMNRKEIETGQVYKEWTDVIALVRKELNAVRKKPEGDPRTDIYPVPDFIEKPKFKAGDIVLRKLEKPRNALGHEVYGGFRQGDFRWDTTPRKVVQVLPYGGKVPYRYILDHMSHVSYSADELMKSKGLVEKFEVKEILERRFKNGKLEYKVWWKGYPKKKADFEPAESLMLDVPEMLKEFDDKINKLRNREKVEVKPVEQPEIIRPNLRRSARLANK